MFFPLTVFSDLVLAGAMHVLWKSEGPGSGINWSPAVSPVAKILMRSITVGCGGFVNSISHWNFADANADVFPLPTHSFYSYHICIGLWLLIDILAVGQTVGWTANSFLLLSLPKNSLTIIISVSWSRTSNEKASISRLWNLIEITEILGLAKNSS